MKSKGKRLSAIRSFLSRGTVSSQEELMQMLAAEGFAVTQATLSRDLRELGVSKTRSIGGSYAYRLPESVAGAGIPVQAPLGGDAIRSLSFGVGLAVIKTFAGLASAVALLIDHRISGGIIGTIAGDDTVLAALQPGVEPESVVSALEALFPGVGEKWQQQKS